MRIPNIKDVDAWLGIMIITSWFFITLWLNLILIKWYIGGF